MLSRIRLTTWQVKLVAFDAAISALTFYLAFSLRTDQFPLGRAWTHAFVDLAAAVVVLRVCSLSLMGIYRIAVRHTSARDTVPIAMATLLSTVLILVYVFLFHWTAIPKTVLIIDCVLSFISVAGSRLGYRIYKESPAGMVFWGARAPARRILVIGAGHRGASLAAEVRRRAREGLFLVGYLDDDPTKQNQLIQGAPVLGTTRDVDRVVEEHGVAEIMIAISSARGKQIREIASRCQDLPVRLRISPGFSELDESDLFGHLRDVEVEDLLRREPVQVDVDEIAAYLADEVVLITGAGGSIGSELVRQIAAVRPARLVLLGHGENSVFEIQQEMRRQTTTPIISVIADIRDAARLRRIFDAYRPTVVFHAAAHKHVPLMEDNPEEAITNNVLGTRNLAHEATRVGVRRFVMISTDKAVNPSSMMGVSKRIAERVIQAESMRSRTVFATVRFGNVLGSRGSVIPLMRGQIARGGPVTVTHPEATRYFMTIPEAVQLVIQAGAMGGSGAIYVLDMGEPIRILDLAHSLIRLSGLRPNVDIAVEITGLRPGEKLQEELLTSEEGTTVTRHERIFEAAASRMPVENVDERVDALIAAAQAGDVSGILRELADLAPLYDPSETVSSGSVACAVAQFADPTLA